jgi:hypothetical protein
MIEGVHYITYTDDFKQEYEKKLQLLLKTPRKSLSGQLRERHHSTFNTDGPDVPTVNLEEDEAFDPQHLIHEGADASSNIPPPEMLKFYS